MLLSLPQTKTSLTGALILPVTAKHLVGSEMCNRTVNYPNVTDL